MNSHWLHIEKPCGLTMDSPTQLCLAGAPSQSKLFKSNTTKYTAVKQDTKLMHPA